MMDDVIYMFAEAFGAAAGWFDDIITAMDAGGILVAAIALVVIVSLLIMPIRGASVGFVGEFVSSPINKARKNLGGKSKGNKKKKGN